MRDALNIQVQCYRNDVLLNAVPIKLNYPIPLSGEVPLVSEFDIIKSAKESLSILHVPGYPYDDVRFVIDRKVQR